MFEVEPGLIIWTTIAFAFLVLLMYKVALPPIIGMLKEREKSIENMLGSAEETRKKADDLLVAYKQKLGEASQEALKLIDQAKVDGSKLKDEIVASAKREAQFVVDKAQGDMAIEKINILTDVKKQAADMVILATEKILKQKIDPKLDRELAEEALKQCQL